MKIVVPLIFISILMITGCTDSSPASVQTQMPDQSTPSLLTYQCASGETIVVNYPTPDLAKVQYKGKNHEMKIAVSASGSRYVTSQLEWWTKEVETGAEGTLFHHLAATNTTGDSIETCIKL